MFVDALFRGSPGPLPFYEFVTPGLCAVEHKAPGTVLYERDVVRFHGKILFLIEKEITEEGRAPSWDATSGVIVGARLGGDLASFSLARKSPIEPGVRGSRLFPRLYLVSADDLRPTVKNAPLILYHGSDEAVERLIDSLDPQQYVDHVSRILVYRRVVIHQALERREWPMSQLKIEIKEVIEDLGVARVIEDLGVTRVIEEVGLARVIEEVGLDDMERAVEQLRREKGARTRRTDS